MIRKKRSIIFGLVNLLGSVTLSSGISAAEVSFQPPQYFEVGRGPVWVAQGDFNGDGIQDLVTANMASPRSLSILLGNGDGTFQPALTISDLSDEPRVVAVGDFNGDNLDDLAAGSNVVDIRLSNGDGTFQPADRWSFGEFVRGITVGDFNGDKVQDLAVAMPKSISSEVAILLGNGDGTFQLVQTLVARSNAYFSAVGDFNEDEVPDLAVVNSSDNILSIFIGHGDGTFQSAGVANPEYGLPISAVVGDFDRDGHQDLAVVHLSGTVSILLGHGDGTFRVTTQVRAANHSWSIVLADFNGDGIADLAVGKQGRAVKESTVISILVGNSDGTFQPARHFEVGFAPESLTVGDFNKDGRPDLAVTNSGWAPSFEPSVAILLNNTPWP